MTVTEVLQGLGSWSVRLSPETPDYIIKQLDWLGHVAILDGRVNVELTGDAMLSAARYVGVLREKPRDDETGSQALGGSGMVFWLGDEDDKGAVIENKLTLTSATLTAAVTAVLPPAVQLGTVYPLTDPNARFTGTFQYMSPRKALGIICDAFGVEFRVRNNGLVDVGRPDQLYNMTAPDSIVVRRTGSSSDMDLTAIGGGFDLDTTTYDYSTRVLLLAETTDDPSVQIATASADAPAVPYKDLFGNTVKLTRVISESSTPVGSAAARAQLQLNRFNRLTRALRITAEQYEVRGRIAVGDNTYVYDPDSGITDPAREVYFQGQAIHPDLVRVSENTWQVTTDQTVAFRTSAGVWIDLTSFVTAETAQANELVVGDLPTSLNRPSDIVADRVDSTIGKGVTPVDASVPKAPTGLTLNSVSITDPKGNNSSVLTISWTAPTQNTDNTSLTDLSHYEVRYRPALRAPLWTTAYAGDTSIDVGAVIDLDYDAQVAAVDTSGHRSAFTAVVSAHTAVDTTAPGVPSDPLVTNYLGQLRIEWNGLTSGGAAMPSDFNRVDVHVGTTSGFTPTSSTLVASLSAKGVAYATAPYGGTRWARLIAYDHNENASTPSGSVSGTTTQVVDTDIFDGAVKTAKLADLAVTNAKIGLLAVNDANIGSLNVGKLVAGTMTADVTISGRFGTALTGARREMNSVGFQAWDASNNLLINLDGANNLLTGRLRTAITGRRLDMGAAGALGEIDFYAPDNTLSYIRAYTESAGVESIQMGVPKTGVASALWNKVHVNSDEWTNIQANKVTFIFGESAGYLNVFSSPDKGITAHSRFSIDGDNLAYSDTSAVPTQRVGIDGAGMYFKNWSDGAFTIYEKGRNSPYVEAAKFSISNGAIDFYIGNTQEFRIFDRVAGGAIATRMKITDTDIWWQWDDGTANVVPRMLFRPASILSGGNTSPGIQLVNVAGGGVLLRGYSDAGSTANPRLEIRNAVDTGFGACYASGFPVQSSRTVKNNVRALAVDPVAKLMGLGIQQFDRKGGRANEVGVIAEELPDELRIDTENDGPMWDITPTLALVIAMLQQMNRRLTAVENRGGPGVTPAGR